MVHLISMKIHLIKIPAMALLILGICQCSPKPELPIGDPDNGGLILPDNFEAVVVVDSVGRTRHIVVNDNGDIYAQLNNSKDGKGTVGLRDLDHDGKADSIVHFGDYLDNGRAGHWYYHP